MQIIFCKFGTRLERSNLRKCFNVTQNSYIDAIDDIMSWNTFTDHLVYKPDPREVDGDYFYVVDFTKKGGYFKIKDFVNDPSCKIRIKS